MEISLMGLEDKSQRIFLLRPFCAIARLVLLFCSLLFAPLDGQTTTAYDDYLRQIEADAKRLAATPITTKDASVENTFDTIERLPLGLQKEEFEKVLRDQFMGTYVFYQRLNPRDKRKIFNLYRQDNQASTIREQTLRLLSNKVP
jgi:hypothetical protein